jgi:hypothetical protein
MLFIMLTIGVCVVVGYAECVIGYVVIIQAYALSPPFVACRILTHQYLTHNRMYFLKIKDGKLIEE